MSWSVSLFGTPMAVAAALDAYAATLSGPSKIEFEAALPNIRALALQNYMTADAPPGSVAPLVDLDASGSGSTAGGREFSRSCNVSLKVVWKKFLQ